MAFQVSPGVNVSEIDLTTVVPATATTEGAIAGVFRWGPVNERILVSSENDLVATFGKPHSALTQAVTPGTFETVTFGSFVLPTDSTDPENDNVTLTVGVESYVVSGYLDGETGLNVTNTVLAENLQAAVANAGVTLFTVGVDGSDNITLTYARYGNQLDVTYTLETSGDGTDGVDDIAPTTVDGTDAVVSSESWSNVETFYSASDFLGYSNALYVVRVSDGEMANGVVGGALENVTAKYPGELGNAISVEIIADIDYGTLKSDTTSTAKLYEFAPGEGRYHVSVIDNSGAITGTAGSVLERFADLSAQVGSKDEYGRASYGPDVLEQRSNYITATSAALWVSVKGEDAKLVGGTDGSDESSIGVSELQKGYDLFANSDEVEVSFLIQGKARGSQVTEEEMATYLINMATARRDAVACVSPGRNAVVGVTNPLTAIESFTAATQRSTYGIVDTGYKYRYDKHNDKYIYTPLNADIAGLCARTDDTRDPWFSPAGPERGLIRNVVKLAYNPSKADRDNLYRLGVNPVITQSGQGTLLFGDKTFSNRPSAFDRINVRRLFIVLQKAIARASEGTLFEFNDEFTRAQFKNLVEPFLRDVQGRRGIYDFKVVCDETNNTPSVIDRNEFVGDIYIKPARSINYVQLNFVAVATGVEFSEVVAG